MDDLTKYYRIMRAALERYEKATRTYNGLIAAFRAEYPDDPDAAVVRAKMDVRVRTATGDQTFFGAEAQTFALAYLVESAQRQRDADEAGKAPARVPAGLYSELFT